MHPEWPFFLYGGDYNPEQWPREVWDEDVALMAKAGWNVATLPVFGWAALEPEEGRFEFEWLDDVLDRMHQGGVRACFATATASVPAWLTQKYPDVLVVNEQGVRQKHGNRHTFCPNSPDYRRLSATLARKIAERYGKHPALLLWHVNNEYGTYCYCDQCAEAFRKWLQRRYGSLDGLNAAWYTSFWGHPFTDWLQIETPTTNGDWSIQTYRLDYRRFMSDSLLDLYKAERDILREATPDVPITTNLMGAFFSLDYHRWGREMDVVSWDNYPRSTDSPAEIAFNHALMRGLREGQPFLLMEQSPSQQNWQAYNRLKPPLQLRLQSYQAVAHGADAVMYFQWRRGRGGIEKLHGAVLEHGGNEENRVFRDVAEIGVELERLGSRLQGARTPARVAVLFDWPNWWGLRLSSGPSQDLDYLQVVRDYYSALHRLGIDIEVLSPQADLSRFDLIVAPMLTMLREADAARIVARVEAGATLVATVFSGLVDENDQVYPEGAPGPWRKVLGLRVEETDAIPPEESNGVAWTLGGSHRARLLADRVCLEGARAIGRYEAAFYAGEPAVTREDIGKGRAYYVATHLEPAGLTHLMERVCKEEGIASPLGTAPPEGVEVASRVREDGERHLYLLNHGTEKVEVPLPEGTYIDLLAEGRFKGSIEMGARAVRILVAQESTH
ncbi:MAG: beta-galactosidase [Fimbriimonas sp.]